MVEIGIKICPKRINKDQKNMKKIIVELKNKQKKFLSSKFLWHGIKWNKQLWYLVKIVLIKMPLVKLKDQFILMI